jgi:hypothetical protein
MKKDVKEVIQGEEPHLNNLLTQEDLSSFKGMVDELRDTWTKKQMWSKLKLEFNDGSFNDKDVNQHQLESYGMQYHEKAKTLNQNSSEAEIFNVMGQLQSLQRIKKTGELESSYQEKEQIEQHGKPKV